MCVWVRFVFLLCCVLGSVEASAQTTFESMMNNIIRGTPGVTNIPITGGSRAVTSGTVAVTAEGFTIPVAATVTADVTAGAIAAGAARVAMRGIPYVGAAIVIADVASAIKDSGIHTCPPPDFFCKPAQPTNGSTSGNTGYYASFLGGTSHYAGSPDDLCMQIWQDELAKYPQVASFGPDVYVVHTPPAKDNPGYCAYAKQTGNLRAQVYWKTPNCVLPAVAVPQSDGTSKCQIPGVDVPANQGDVAGAVTAAGQNDPSLWPRLMTDMGQVSAQNPGLAPPVDVTNAPAVVTAPTVQTQPKVASTTTLQNPDGTTSTQTTTKAVTVTTTQGTPATVASPNVNVQPSVTTTTTTTNNTTNTTTTTTTVNNPPAQTPQPSVPDLKLPTDYNREVTQQKILDKLNDMNGAITATAPTGDDSVAAVKAQNDTNMATVSTIDAGSTGLKAWFPSLPTATCANPQVPNPVSGSMVAVPICDKVSVFQTFISGVICVFALFGSVREVQAAFKA